ncbi:MAG TPA: MASE1 domain-containing protein [Candidatus Angelobacter sp.]|nr:MASE1 domain-containing protein [Candidatus Angelobacter sp.]
MSKWEQRRAFLASLAGKAEAAPAGERMRVARDLLVLVILAAIYFFAGKLGLKLAYFHPSATAVWPPTGIALVAFLMLGYRVWPGIFLGALLVNLTTAGTLPVCIGIAAGNTLEGLLGCYLLKRFAGGEEAFETAKGVLAFVLLAATISTTVSATFGVTSLVLGGFAHWADSGSIWLTWWLGDAVGALVVAPLLVLWSNKPQLKWNRARLLEVVLLLAYLFVAGQATFGNLLPLRSKNYPLEFLCVPALIWAAFRFRPRRAQLATCLLAGIVIYGTLRGYGPFVRPSHNEALLLAQAFTGVMAVMTLLVATVVEEQLRTAEQIRQLAVTDPLTGLANYRKLMETLDNEIKRSDRTGRSFAIVLLDLDELKKINDTHGHLVGSRALCRVAAALSSATRTTDLPARYGGDEFALVLPEANRRAAAEVTERFAKKLASDRESPEISVSFGIAVFPFDARDVEALLRWADAALYRMKSRPGASRSAVHA